MILLEYLYEKEFTKINFFERKKKIDHNYTILLGPPKSGKSYLIYDYLSNFKSEQYLYIDFNDPKITNYDFIVYLQNFIDENSIEVLVLENFKFTFEIPKVTNIIITTNISKTILDFSIVRLMPLDFEEFILFDTKHQNITNSFNNFLKYGNIPEIIEIPDQKKHIRNYEICKLYTNSEVELQILLLLIRSSSEKKSIFQLFNQLKKTTKISKDRFYSVIESFIKNNIIFFIEKYNQPKATKKIFLFNHALLDIATYQKNFNNLFKNMIFLELYHKKYDLFYLENIDFYIPKLDTIILSIPFFNDFLWEKLAKNILLIIQEYNIKNIYILTVSNTQIIYLEEIEVNIIPFVDWVLGE